MGRRPGRARPRRADPRPDAPSRNAREGDKVAFEITAYPDADYLGEGVITKVLGEAGEPSVETQAVIETYNLPGEFPRECVDEALDLSMAFDERMRREAEGEAFDTSERLDLRDTLILTIDPPDARDYDDAISIERLDDIAGGGPGWRLGVHIADVANFVTPGSALDREATGRANSVYLPRLVIPMLPEVLSNGICSLQEGVPRFAKTAFIDYDDRGNVRGRGFAASLIKSARRLTYLEAQAIIDGDPEEAKKHAKTEPVYTPEVVAALKSMNTLSRAIRERRRRAGMIHLDLPEVDLVFDEDGRVVDAVPEDDAYTHTLIEMFMVEANEAVARLFEDLGVPLLRRVHPDPVPGEMGDLSRFVKVAGYKLPKAPTREELQGLLEATKGSPAAPAVHFAVLRTLTRAEYSPELIGHFALASEAYAHFTSPIRRYPDLTVHRALTRYLQLTENGERPPRSEGDRKAMGRELRDDPACPDHETLRAVGANCNAREQNATDAERDLRQFLVLQLLEEHIGASFPGLITGVTGAGAFVRLDKYLAEGLVKTEDLPAPPGNKGGRVLWRIDRRSGALVEQNSGRSFNIGDRVEVTVLEIDLAARQMNLSITDAKSRDVGKGKKPAPSVASGLRLGDQIEIAARERKTGAQKRAQRSKSRDRPQGRPPPGAQGQGQAPVARPRAARRPQPAPSRRSATTRVPPCPSRPKLSSAIRSSSRPASVGSPVSDAIGGPSAMPSRLPRTPRPSARRSATVRLASSAAPGASITNSRAPKPDGSANDRSSASTRPSGSASSSVSELIANVPGSPAGRGPVVYAASRSAANDARSYTSTRQRVPAPVVASSPSDSSAASVAVHSSPRAGLAVNDSSARFARAPSVTSRGIASVRSGAAPPNGRSPSDRHTPTAGGASYDSAARHAPSAARHAATPSASRAGCSSSISSSSATRSSKSPPPARASATPSSKTRGGSPSLTAIARTDALSDALSDAGSVQMPLSPPTRPNAPTVSGRRAVASASTRRPTASGAGSGAGPDAAHPASSSAASAGAPARAVTAGSTGTRRGSARAGR